MSDYELVSGPSSPRSTCSSTSSRSTCAGSSTLPNPPPPAVRGLSDMSQAQEALFAQMTIPIKPKLSMRSVSTPVNLLVCGASGSGKSSFISAFTRMFNTKLDPGASAATGGFIAPENGSTESWRVSGTGPSADPHAVLLAGPHQFAAAVGPIPVPEAGRELLYKLQDCPGHGATLDPAGYLEALLTFLLQQQQKDFDQLHGSKGMPKALVCGSLTHSITACLYFLPPAGPSKLDLVLMAGLSRHVALLPVVGRADSMTPAEAEHCCKLVQHMLAAPGEYVAGLGTITAYGAAKSCSPFLLSTRGPGALPGGGSAGLCKLLALLTGDEVYGLLDHAWDMYTAFCGAHSAGSKSFAALVAEACAAATHAHLPSLTGLNKTERQLAEVKHELTVERKELAAEKQQRIQLQGSLDSTSIQLKQWRTAADEVQGRLNDASVQLKPWMTAVDELKERLRVVQAERDEETRMLTEMCKVDAKCRSCRAARLGYGRAMSAALKQRLAALHNDQLLA